MLGLPLLVSLHLGLSCHDCLHRLALPLEAQEIMCLPVVRLAGMRHPLEPSLDSLRDLVARDMVVVQRPTASADWWCAATALEPLGASPGVYLKHITTIRSGAAKHTELVHAAR